MNCDQFEEFLASLPLDEETKRDRGWCLTKILEVEMHLAKCLYCSNKREEWVKKYAKPIC